MSIKFESADGIARVTLAAPERRNSLTPAEFAELRDVLAAIARTPEDRAVVLTGAAAGGRAADCHRAGQGTAQRGFYQHL